MGYNVLFDTCIFQANIIMWVAAVSARGNDPHRIVRNLAHKEDQRALIHELERNKYHIIDITVDVEKERNVKLQTSRGPENTPCILFKEPAHAMTHFLDKVYSRYFQNLTTACKPE